jgi:hypothetical protein
MEFGQVIGQGSGLVVAVGDGPGVDDPRLDFGGLGLRRPG